MEKIPFIKQICTRSNGQAIIYLYKKELAELDLAVDDFVELRKVKRIMKTSQVK